MCVGTWRALGVWRIFRCKAAGGLFASKAVCKEAWRVALGNSSCRWLSILKCFRVSQQLALLLHLRVFRVQQMFLTGFLDYSCQLKAGQCDRLHGPKKASWASIIRKCEATSLAAKCAKGSMTGMCAGSRMTRDKRRHGPSTHGASSLGPGKSGEGPTRALNGPWRYHRNMALLPAVFHSPSMRCPFS